MLFPFFGKIEKFLENILNFLLKVVILISSFFIIYLGVKTYLLSRNFKDIKTAAIYLILGIILIALVFLNKEVILKTIEYFARSFK